MVDKKEIQTLSAVCGLFCPSCTIYIGSTEDPQRLEKFASTRGKTVEEIRCYGCHSEKRTLFCQTCIMVRCAAEKGLAFCGQCPEYPCKDIQEFQAARPHRIDLWQSQARLKEVGRERWFAEQIERYACPKCGTINSAYDMICRKCSYDPANAYVSENKTKITAFLSPK